ncbi:MAG: radical SAM protein [Candidatus Hydrogenedentota bacterium]|nr:MAG: radical SAM protein [Candidatus Hydrogenedentota bacterium]
MLVQLAGKIRPNPYGPDTVGTNFGLHFTGGEPFLNYELLRTAVETAHDLQIPSLFVETNCYWCIDDKVTEEKLHDLKGRGLKGILISVNPFYLEYVPFERTERAIRISLEVFGENVMVYQLEYYKRFKAMGIEGRVALEDYLGNLEKRDYLIRNVEFFVTGRAAYKLQAKLGELFPRFPANHFFSEPCRPSFLRNWHNHFDNYGNYVPGYCGGISLGDCRELDKLLNEGIRLEEYPLLQFLMNEDLKGLFQFSEDFGYRERREGYLSKCHLCIDVRKHLAGKEQFKELRPTEFYSHLE